MKLDTGTEARSGLVHSVHTTAANASDVTEAHRLVHGGKAEAWGDAGYQGVAKRPEHRGSQVRWQVAMRPGLRRQLAPGRRRRSGGRPQVRAKAEHPYLYVQRHFGYAKVRYRGSDQHCRH